MDEITAAQAATLTGLSERTIRRKIASGAIPARRLATNRYAIRVSDLHMSRPLEALMLRLEALEQRLESLEAYVRHSQMTSPTLEPATEEALPPAIGPIPNAELQRLFSHLAYETARLARSIPFPLTQEESAQESARPIDEERTTRKRVSDLSNTPGSEEEAV